jgi:hypothetical protein
MAISAFSASGRAKNRRAASSSEDKTSSEAPCSAMQKKPTSRQAWSIADATASAPSPPERSGLMSMTGSSFMSSSRSSLMFEGARGPVMAAEAEAAVRRRGTVRETVEAVVRGSARRGSDARRPH